MRRGNKSGGREGRQADKRGDSSEQQVAEFLDKKCPR